MSVKLTKSELRSQQGRLGLLQKYLPTLQLKKALLQTEVSAARGEIESLKESYIAQNNAVEQFSAIYSERLSFDLAQAAQVHELRKHFDNIAGVEVPRLEGISFKPFSYSLFDTPVWVDSAIMHMQQLIVAKVKVEVAIEKKEALEKELREVSIRVNLFEKILIPRSTSNIKAIKLFLGDQQLAAIARTKVAKAKLCA